MKRNKKLLTRCKRFLALLLAVTMVTGELPASVAYAAEPLATEQEAVADVSAGENPAEAETDSEAAAEASPVAEAAPEGAAGGEAAPGVAADGEAGSGAAASSEAGSGAAASSEAGSSEAASSEAGSSEAASSEAGSGEAPSSAPAPVEEPLKTTIAVNEGKLTSQLDYIYDYTTMTVETHFQEGAPTYADDVLEAVRYAAYVEVDGDTKADLKGKLTYKWQQQGADGSFSDMAADAVPTAVGMYQVVAKLDAEDKVCTAAEAVLVHFEVKKAILTLGKIEIMFDAGSSVADIKKANEDVVLMKDGEEVAKDVYWDSITTEVQDAYTNAPLAADTDVLQKNRDYRIVFTVALKEAVKGSYEVEENTFPIEIAAPVETKIVVTYTTPGKTIGKNYDGSAIDAETMVKPEFTAKVVKLVVDKDGKEQEQELAGAELTYAWCDANKEEYADEKFAPVDAGTYFYKLSYTDANRSYADAEAYVKVEIKMVDIVIEPVLDPAEVFEGVSVRDILKRVDYKVYRLVNGEKNAEEEKINRDYYWGVAYNVSNGGDDTNNASGSWDNYYDEENDEYYHQNHSGQSYEPVFVIQQSVKDEEGKIVDWINLDDYDEIEKDYEITVTAEDGTETKKTLTYEYRLSFSGQKAIYDKNGNIAYEYDEDDGYHEYLSDINSAQTNYTVDSSISAMAKYAVTLKVNASTETEVNVDEIVKTFEGNGKGTWEEPIVVTYTGEGLYKTKDLYKKAVAWGKPVGAEAVKLAENTDSKLTYTWQEVDYWEEVEDKDDKTEAGDQTDGEKKKKYEPVWGEELSFNNVEANSSPKKAGVYRLAVTYSDPTSEYKTATNYVYYTIKPQDALMVLSGTPTIYADNRNTVADLIYNIQNYVPEDTETYVGLEVLAVTVTDDAQGNGVVNKGETPVPIGISTSWIYDHLKDYFYVERKLTEGEDAGKWVLCDMQDVFEKDTEYRLCIGNYYNSNYNFGRKLDVHNRVVKEDWYANESVPVKLKATQAVEVKISVDESKITGNEKTYDGQPFNLEELKKLVKVTTVKDNADVTDKVTLQYMFYDGNIVSYYDEADGSWGSFLMDSYVPVEYAVHGGKYKLRISLDTDDTYQKNSLELDTEYVIRQKTLTVKPELVEKIYAGAYDRYDDLQVVTGYLVAGELPGEEGSILATPTWGIYERTSDRRMFTGYSDEYLRSSESYYVKAAGVNFKLRPDENYGLYVNGDRDYKVENELTAFTPVRKLAQVQEYKENDRMVAWSTRLNDKTGVSETNDFTHEITALEGVPYIYKNDGLSLRREGEAGKTVEGNYFLFRLYQPEEFNAQKFCDNGFVYRNSIEEQGGYIYGDSGEYEHYIDIAFDAGKGGKPTFTVLWEEGYAETYTVDLDSMILEDDMSKAVAPKSLSFNGVNTKMAVGDTQQLDVKVTKAQMGDVILLGYKSGNEDVLQVTDTGFVTALSASKTAVTVEVYPCYMENGVKTPIPGATKSTKKVNIKVSEVAAPKLGKVTAQDTYAVLSYNKPSNGYRREVYVLSGKNRKADEFEQLIGAVKNGDYSAFVYTRFTEPAADKKGVVTTGVFNLEPGTDYTVYVRNVSGLRKLDDGRTVAASHGGAVKSFKTTPSQVQQIWAYFDADAKGQTALWNSEIERYEANLSGKSAKLSVDGKFLERYSKNYSDEPDYIWRTLPLDKSLKKTYQAPKLVYYVSENRYDNEWDAINNWGYGNYVGITDEDDTWYYKKTATIASVDKSGKVTFKGKGSVYVLAMDTNTGYTSIIDYLYINAAPNSVKAKNIKMVPGQTIYLSDYLEYKEGKTKVVNYEKYFSYLSTTAVSNDDYKITRVRRVNDVQGTYFTDYMITALKAGGKLDLDVTDIAVTANGGSAAKVKLTTAAVEPVKSLKAKDVFDDRFTATFLYSQRDYEFRFELKDARGSVIRNEVLELDADSYDSKSKKYTYNVYFGEDIKLLSNYTLTVTALCNGQPSKEAKLKVKTTNIPASYWDLKSGVFGGSNVKVSTADGGRGISLDGTTPVLKTGNTYTLDMALDDTWMDNYSAKTRLTDSLIWKSTNTKVATIKANAGTFSAKLKTVKQGSTTIEVSSKMTKKVIARYKIYVNAVADADNFFGEAEPYKYFGVPTVVVNEKDMLAITIDNPITTTLNKGEAQWFVFTAPAYGEYDFYTTSADRIYYYLSLEDAKNGKYATNSSSFTDVTLEKNGKVYVYADKRYGRGKVTVKADGVMYQNISMGVNLLKGGQTFQFTAPEDNVYTFTYTDGEDSYPLESDTVSLKEGKTYSHIVDGEPNREYTITVTKRELESTALTVGGDGVSVELKKADENAEYVEKWYAFKASEANLYEFFSTGASGNLKAELYTSLAQEIADYGSNEGAPDFKLSDKVLEKDETIYLRVSTSAATTEQAVTAKLHVKKREVNQQPLAIGGEGASIELKAGEELWYQFTADELNLYSFRFSGVTKEMNAALFAQLTDLYSLYSESGSADFVIKDKELDKNQTMYLRLSLADAAEGETMTVKLEIKKRVPEAFAIKDEDTEITIEENEEKWLAITPTERNYYNFSFTGATTDVEVEFYEALTDASGEYWGTASTADGIFKPSVELKSGIKKYLKLTAAGATKDAPAKVKVRVKKRAVDGTALTVGGEGTEITLNKNEEKWLVFTPDEENYYTFSFTEVDGDEFHGDFKNKILPPDNRVGAEIGCYGYSFTKDLTVRKDSGNWVVGKPIYLRLVADSATTDTPVKFRLTITKRELEKPALTVDTPTEITLKEGETKWYEFTPDEAQYYMFSFTDAETDYIRGTLTSQMYPSDKWKWPNKSLEGNYDGGDFKRELEIREGYISFEGNGSSSTSKVVGEKLYLMLSARNKETDAEGNELKESTFKLTITKRKVEKTLTVGTEETITLKEGEEKWYAFTPDEAQYYTLNFSGEAQDAQITISGVLCSRLVPSKEPEWLYNGNFNSYISGTAQARNELGVYDKGVKIQYNSRNNGYYNSNSAGDNTVLGQPLYLKLSAQNNGTDTEGNQLTESTFKLTITKREKGTLTLGGAVDITLNQGEVQWYELNADEENLYTFTFTHADSRNPSVRVKLTNSFVPSGESTVEQTKYVGSIGADGKDKCDVPVYGESKEQGSNDLSVGKVYVGLSLNSDDGNADPVSLKLTVTRREVESTALTLGETGTEISLQPGQTKWYAFTAEEDNAYRFYSENATGYIDAYAYSELTSSSYGGYNSSRDDDFNVQGLGIKKGKKGYLMLTASGTANGSDATPVTATVKVEKKRTVESTPLTLAEGGIQVSLVSGKAKWYAFTAEEANRYRFSVKDATGSVTIYYYSSLDITKQEGFGSTDANGAASLSEKLVEKGKTVYVEVEADKGTEDAPTTATICVEKTITPKVLTVGSEGESIQSAGSNEETWYSFTANETGVYEFDVEAPDSVYGSRYLGFYHSLAEDSSFRSITIHFRSGKQKYLCLPMEKNETVYLCLKMESQGMESCVTVEKTASAKAVGASGKANATVGANGKQAFYYTVPADGTYELTIALKNSTSNYNMKLYVKDMDESYTTMDYSKGSYNISDCSQGTKLWIMLEDKSASDSTDVTLTITPSKK